MRKLYYIIDYLNKEKLVLATAESCTAGEVIATLAKQGDCGDCLFIGYVVYNKEAKMKQLGVKEETIQKHTLTSEEVASEMAYGAFQHEKINLTIAITGITGKKSMDGIPPGTICFAWGFKEKSYLHIYTDTQWFKGSPAKISLKATYHALSQIKKYHQLFLKNEIH